MIKQSCRFLTALGLVLLYVSLVRAQLPFDPVEDVGLTVGVEPSEITPGEFGRLQIALEMPKNTHITNRDLGFFFIKPEKTEGVKWGEAVFPKGNVWRGDTVYQGQVVVSVPFTLAGNLESGSSLKLLGTIGYQGCTEVDPIICIPPVERDFNISLRVDEGTVNRGGLTADESKGLTADDNAKLTVEERVKRALETGSLTVLIWIFIGGVLLSFTPCVYPIIPITIAFVGAKAGGNKLKGFSLSLVFVLGLALMYSLLGVIAAATGSVFGLGAQNPWVIGFVTLVFIAMGAGMLGAFEMTLPSSIQNKLASGKRTGYLGALFVGATTGLVAAPCLGPVLVALLSWVSSTGSLFYGFLYLFVFACGIGLLFVVIGTFAGVVSTLPKSGGWMIGIKHGFGIILIAAAFYFGKPLVSDDLFILLVGLGLVILAAFFGVFNRLDPAVSTGKRIGRGISFFVLVIGAFYTLLGLVRLEGINSALFQQASQEVLSSQNRLKSLEVEHGINWIHGNEDEAFRRARTTGKPVIIDFWADWCTACWELDHKTFSDPVIYRRINRDFVPLRINGSKVNEEIEAVWARFNIKGLPTVLCVSPENEELGRFEAFRTTEQILPLLKWWGSR